MNDRQRYRLILNAVKAGNATNWRQSDNPFMPSRWHFEIADIAVKVDDNSVFVSPVPSNTSECIVLGRRASRLLTALADQGLVRTHDVTTNAAWDALTQNAGSR